MKLKVSKLAGLVALLVGAIIAQVGAQKAHAFGSAPADLPELEVVQDFEVQRYLGLWFEIASFPQSFQKGCTGTTAEYSLINSSTVRVVNKCYQDSLDGELREAHGKAKIPDLNEPSKLKVSFFWPFSGAYWVIELGENYEYAVVGHPSRDYLWILSRTPQMDAQLVQEIIARQAAKGFDMSRLKFTLQR
jgi:apolipoprotein D and lipocalin family protein